MANRLGRLLLVAAIALVLVACGSASYDVPSLSRNDTQVVEPTADAANAVLDDEAMMMALVQCLRDKGYDVDDPTAEALD
jgi:hypothetical protein